MDEMWMTKRSSNNLSDRYVGIITFPARKFSSKFDIMKSGLPLSETLEKDPHIFDKLWDYRIKSILHRFNQESKVRDRLQGLVFDYATENQTMLLLFAEHHPEPILDMISRIEHEIEVHQWSVGAIINKSDYDIKQCQAVEFIQLKQVPTSHTCATEYFDSDHFVLVRLIGKWTFAALYDEQAFMGLTSYNTFDGDRDFTDVGGRELHFIKFVDRLEPFMETVQGTRSRLSPTLYDPLLAQLNEIKNSIAQNAITLAQDIDRRFKQLTQKPVYPQFRTETPFSVQFIKDYIKTRRNALNPVNRRTLKNQFRVVDEIGSELGLLVDYLANIENALALREERTQTSSLNDLKIHMLAAAQQVSVDIMRRSKLHPESKNLFVFPSQRLGIESLDSITLGADRRTLIPGKNYLLLFPVKYLLRLGSFALLSHPIAHLLSGISPSTEVTEEVGRRYVNFLDAKERGSINEFVLGQEIIAHATATAISGPAYLFAVARFTTGLLESMVEQKETVSRYLLPCPLFLVLRSCIGIIHEHLPDFAFPSSVLGQFKPIIDKQLVNISRNLVGRPYGIVDHFQKMPKIKKALMNGQITKTDSILILNSLWDAVTKKEGYLNEIAALISIADRTKKPYPSYTSR